MRQRKRIPNRDSDARNDSGFGKAHEGETKPRTSDALRFGVVQVRRGRGHSGFGAGTLGFDAFSRITGWFFKSFTEMVKKDPALK